MDNSKKELLNEDLKSLKKILKKYTNYYKALYQLNPSAADDFKKKQEHYYTVNKKSKEHEGCHISPPFTKPKGKKSFNIRNIWF